MFQESLVESSPLLRTKNRWPVLASIAAQAAVVTAIVAIPLLHPEILPIRAPRLTLIGPPPPPQRPPTPPPQPVRMEAAAAATAAPSAPATAAPRIHATMLTTSGPGVDSPLLPSGVNIGIAGPGIPGIGVSGPPGPSISIAPPAGPADRPRISNGVSTGLLLAPIKPEYPAIARITRTEGTVVIQAIISKSGLIESAHAISGPQMLQEAALQAVRSARYRPYLLNNEPTEVETTITIAFHMYN